MKSYRRQDGFATVNVRGLENALERALALARSDRIGIDDLPPELARRRRPWRPPTTFVRSRR